MNILKFFIKVKEKEIETYLCKVYCLNCKMKKIINIEKGISVSNCPFPNCGTKLLISL